jgi:hypothetical protein
MDAPPTAPDTKTRDVPLEFVPAPSDKSKKPPAKLHGVMTVPTISTTRVGGSDVAILLLHGAGGDLHSGHLAGGLHTESNAHLRHTHHTPHNTVIRRSKPLAPGRHGPSSRRGRRLARDSRDDVVPLVAVPAQGGSGSPRVRQENHPFHKAHSRRALERRPRRRHPRDGRVGTLHNVILQSKHIQLMTASMVCSVYPI